MKIKLPRKRKKRYIKKPSPGDYLTFIIINEMLYEKNPLKCNTRFSDCNSQLTMRKGKYVPKFNY